MSAVVISSAIAAGDVDDGSSSRAGTGAGELEEEIDAADSLYVTPGANAVALAHPQMRFLRTMFLEREQDALLQEYKSKLVREASVGALHRLNAAQDSLRSLRDEREVNFSATGSHSAAAAAMGRGKQDGERYGYGGGGGGGNSTVLARRNNGSGSAGARGWIERSFDKVEDMLHTAIDGIETEKQATQELREEVHALIARVDSKDGGGGGGRVAGSGGIRYVSPRSMGAKQQHVAVERMSGAEVQ